MKLEVLKKRLGVNSRQVRELIKSCGFTDVRNYGENHLQTMSDYADKIGMKVYVNPVEEDKLTSDSIEVIKDTFNEKTQEFDTIIEVEKLQGTKKEEDEGIPFNPEEDFSEIKVNKGDLIHILSKAYDVGYAAGKNIEPESINTLSEILADVIEGKVEI